MYLLQRTCLHLAASEGNFPIVEYLITEARASINCVDRFGGTPLADAIRYAHSAVAKCLISHGAELKWDEVRASGELCEAARKGDVFRIELLLLAKCDVNSADYDQRSAAHLAASEGASAVVEMLIENGARLDHRDRWGGTPLSTHAGLDPSGCMICFHMPPAHAKVPAGWRNPCRRGRRARWPPACRQAAPR